MSEEQKEKEDEVFDQELSADDLDAASGGVFWPETDKDINNCIERQSRPIYGGGGFPNCAGTVEKGSNCWGNDGCRGISVIYTGKRTDCGRAWE